VPGRVGSGKQSPFTQLGRRVVAYLRPKCTALLYDHSINSPRTARLNVYQSFLLAAIKLHCFIAAASQHPARGGGSGGGGGGSGSGGGSKGAGSEGGGGKGGGGTGGGPSASAVHAAVNAGVRYMEGAVGLYKLKSVAL
jgi:hypothetical protein